MPSQHLFRSGPISQATSHTTTFNAPQADHQGQRSQPTAAGILLVSAEPHFRHHFAQRLRRSGYDVYTTAEESAAAALIAEKSLALVLLHHPSHIPIVKTWAIYMGLRLISSVPVMTLTDASTAKTTTSAADTLAPRAADAADRWQPYLDCINLLLGPAIST